MRHSRSSHVHSRLCGLIISLAQIHPRKPVFHAFFLKYQAHRPPGQSDTSDSLPWFYVPDLSGETHHKRTDFLKQLCPLPAETAVSRHPGCLPSGADTALPPEQGVPVSSSHLQKQQTITGQPVHPAWIKFLLQGSHNTFPLSHPPRHLLQIPRLPDPAFLFHPAGHPSQNGSSQAPTGFRPLPLLSVSHCYFFRIFRQMPSRTGMRSTVCEAELPRLPAWWILLYMLWLPAPQPALFLRLFWSCPHLP